MRHAARPLSIVAVLILGLVSTGRVAADPPDPRTLLQQAAAAMGGASPTDSRIDATITIEIGGATYSGTVEYRSLGDDKTREIHDVPDRDRDTTFDRGYAKLVMGEEAKPLPPQLAASAQAFAFPLVLANAYLNNPESAFAYVGTDVVHGNTVHVVKAWDTAASDEERVHFADCSAKNFLIDATDSLVLGVDFGRLPAFGIPEVPVTVRYSSFQSHAGKAVPRSISATYNGSPWQTISVTAVTFNNGYSSTDFSVE